jgi:hypothetical protein
MVVLTDLDRFHLVADVIDRVPKLGCLAAYAKQAIKRSIIKPTLAITGMTCRKLKIGSGLPREGIGPVLRIVSILALSFRSFPRLYLTR